MSQPQGSESQHEPAPKAANATKLNAAAGVRSNAVTLDLRRRRQV
jgi:hypothetical protein